MTTILLVIIAVLLFGLIITIHEFGHFFTAKLSGIMVNEFAIGMGPKLFGFRKGETKYTLRLLPIGGYCAMEGENEESQNARAFNNKPVWKRIIVVVAGGIMNIVLGLILMSVIVMQSNLLPINQIAAFSEGSLLQAAGARVDDYILSIDGYKISTEMDLSVAIGSANPDSVDFVLERNGEKIELNNIRLDSYNTSKGRKAVVVDFSIYGVEKTPWRIIKKTVANTYSMVRMVISSFIGLVSGKYGLNEISGPVGVAQAITEAASSGLENGLSSAINNIITIMAVISINLGIFNLLPFPALDGGRFVLLVIEGIRRKPIPRKYEAYINAVGFLVLILIMLLITGKDIIGLIK